MQGTPQNVSPKQAFELRSISATSVSVLRVRSARPPPAWADEPRKRLPLGSGVSCRPSHLMARTQAKSSDAYCIPSTHRKFPEGRKKAREGEEGKNHQSAEIISHSCILPTSIYEHLLCASRYSRCWDVIMNKAGPVPCLTSLPVYRRRPP